MKGSILKTAVAVALGVFRASALAEQVRVTVTNLDVLDAGTEVNDEAPANTAFFGQAAPNTGIDESGLVQFRQLTDGGNILAGERLSMADFSL
jgi:hypothetical protein